MGIMKKGRGVAAVDRALQILDAFNGADGILTLTAIAAKTSLYKSTILRIIESLEDFNYIRRLEDGRYQVGPKPFELGRIYQSSFKIADYVLPSLDHIVKETNESGSFYVREGKMRILLYRVDGKQSVRDHVRSGDMLSLDKGAAGRTLIRFQDGMERDSRRVDAVTESFGERDPNVAAVAGPVFGVLGRLQGALTVSGPRERLTDPAALKKIRKVVREEASRLSIMLGAPRDQVDSLFRVGAD